MSTIAVARGIATRSLMMIPRVPSTFVPSVVMPVFLTLAFTGPFSDLVKLPGFPANAIIDWILPMTMVQGALIAGITTGMAVARDFETGFYDRFLMSPAPRNSLLAGPLMAALVRACIPMALLLVVALLGGAHFRAGLLGIATLALACFGMAAAGGAWATALALRFKTYQIAPLMQAGVFLSIFTSTAQMPLDLMTGWIHAVARVNPVTNILALARQGFLGEVTWDGTWPGLVSIAGILGVLLVFAYRSMRKVIP